MVHVNVWGVDKHRIDLGQGLTGWEYSLPFDGIKRVFDNGRKAWFFYFKKNRRTHAMLTVHHSKLPTMLGEYRCQYSVYPRVNGDYTIEYYGHGQTMHEAFMNLRKYIKDSKRAIRSLPKLKKYEN